MTFWCGRAGVHAVLTLADLAPHLAQERLPLVAVAQERAVIGRFTRTGLSAVTLEPLRPWAAHVVQLRSIAAVRQDGSDGPQNGHEIHARFPHAIFPAHVVAGRCGQDMDVVGQQCGMSWPRLTGLTGARRL